MKSEAVIKLAEETEELRIVWGEVYIPNRPDSDKDWMDASTIRKMAHNFLRDRILGKIDVQHNNQEVGAQVVESFIARKGDPDFIEGSWVVGVHVPDDATWGKIKKGEINGFSIEALTHRTPTPLEVEIPPVIQGRTQKADDGHEHAFYVSYDEQGTFKGGMTDVVNGHQHLIRRGAATETVSGHNHRFSHLEYLSGD